MADSFTTTVENSFWNNECEDFTAEDIRKYLETPEHFRDFADGLRQLMKQHGYAGNSEDIRAQVQFLVNAVMTDPYFRDLPQARLMSLRKNLRNWLTGSNRPDMAEGNRERVFDILLALGCTMEEVNWFQSHVYFDRPFYCRSIRDAVYFFSFYHGYTPEHCRLLLEQVSHLDLAVSPEHPVNTQAVREKLEHIRSGDDEELIRFIQANGSAFTSWQVKATTVIKALLNVIQGKKEDKENLDQYIRQHELKNLSDTGYVVQEYALLHRSAASEFPDVSIDSIDFMLAMILNSTETGKAAVYASNEDLNKLIRRNFPNRNVFSSILKGSSKSYEAVRKVIILLQFYACAFMEPLEVDAPSASGHFDYYETKMNDALDRAGFDTLFYGNPYDLIFMLAARSDEPLLMLRDIISMACNED